jgi:hypothetical protein
MEIHKPRPWHGARELAKEIGVIVIGVLIALGAEQVVRSLHERNEIREAREALHAELVNDASTIQIMLLEDQCMLAGVDRMMARGGPRLQEATFTGLFYYPGGAVWDTVRAGAAAHMPLKEKLAYVNFYGDVTFMQAIAARNLDLFTDLAGYGRVTTPTETQAMVKVLTRARALLRGKVQGDRYMLTQVKSLGARPRPPRSDQRATLEEECRWAGVPLGASD